MAGIDFSGRVVLVTGAGKGLGRKLAQAFARSGAQVACQDATPINLDETVARIQSAGGISKDYIFDLAKKMPVQALIEQIVADWGSLDIVVNHFWVKPFVSVLKMDEWDWHRTVDTNLGGAFFTVQSAGRVMQDLGGGVIVNLVTQAGEQASEAQFAAYYASMAGIIELTRLAGREYQAYNVRLYAVVSRYSDSEAGKDDGSHEAQVGVPGSRAHLGSKIVDTVLNLCGPDGERTFGKVVEVQETREG